MASKFDRRTLLAGRRSGRGRRSPAASALGPGLGRHRPVRRRTARAATGSPPRPPKQGGSLVFGVDAEESGFDPTQARFDEVGVMYARTVFDPLTIILANGDWAPYLAAVGRAQRLLHRLDRSRCGPNLVFHDGTPCNGAALLTNLAGPVQVAADRHRPQPDARLDHPDRARWR